MAKKSRKAAMPVIEQYNLTIMQNQRTVKELTDWKRAIQAAESLTAPQRKTLYDLYMNIMLDPHVTAVYNKRILSVTNVSWSVVDTNGEEIEDLTKTLDTTFFEDILTYAIESRMYGYSLMQINWQDRIVELIPRAHVNPKEKLVVSNPLIWGQGIAYNEPPYTNLVLEVGKPDDLGLLIKVAPYAIMKRNDVSDWATFTEIFGMPMRVVYYDPNMPSNRIEADKAMQEMGGAGYLVLPDGSRVEFPSTGSSQGNDTYDRFADFCNKEISKCLVGQTMTTEDGASLSQSQVHLKAEDRIAQNDLKFVERVLNERLMPILIAQGITVPAGARFQPVEEEQSISKDVRLEMDLRIHNEVGHLPKQYFKEEYNVEFVDSSDAPTEAPTSPKSPKKTKGKEVKVNNSDFEAGPSKRWFQNFFDFFAQAPRS